MASLVLNVLSWTGYTGLVFLMFAENVFPPIPSELIVPFAGYLASREKLTLAGVVLAGTCGSVLGALFLYYTGQRLGYERTLRFARSHGRWLTLCERDVQRAKRWFERHGGAAVLLCRMVPGIRSLISIPAGIGSMRLVPFVAYTTVGSAFWTAILAVMGYVLARRFHEIEQYLDPVSWVVFGLLIVIYVVRVVRIMRSPS